MLDDKSRRRCLRAVGSAGLIAALTGPSAAHATLAYTKSGPSVWVAKDDGSSPHRLAKGNGLLLAPDGHSVLYETSNGGQSFTSTLKLIKTAGGAARTLLKVNSGDVHAFSPDSHWVAALSGSPLGQHPVRKLVLINVATAKSRTIASGDFDGVSFSPDSSQLVYGKISGVDSQQFPRENLFVAGVLASGASRQLTTDGRSGAPLWGPQQIAFSHYTRGSAPNRNIWLINPDGSGSTVLTHDAMPAVDDGLKPKSWSADGSRLLARFDAIDPFPLTVDIASGKESRLPKHSGLEAAALSRDGLTVLGTEGAIANHPEADVVTLPATGGKAKVLVRNAAAFGWTR